MRAGRVNKLLVDPVDFTPVIMPDEQQAYAFRRDLTYGAVIDEVIYVRGVPRGILSKDVTLDPLQNLGMTIRLEGIVGA